MIDIFQRLAARVMSRVRVNWIGEEVRGGVEVIVKRRRAGGDVVIWFGNRFLSLARSGIEMFVDAERWLDWEIHCVGLLYPEFPASREHGWALIVHKFHGTSLRRLLGESVERRAFAAAGRELRRAHQIMCDRYKACWSHGDLHLDNVLYDAGADRAFLIDFDTRHELRLGWMERQADDLKVMLLELITGIEQWGPVAEALLEGYGDGGVLAALGRQMVVPRGVAKIFWHTRTGGMATREVERRLEELRALVARVGMRVEGATRREGASCSVDA